MDERKPKPRPPMSEEDAHELELEDEYNDSDEDDGGLVAPPLEGQVLDIQGDRYVRPRDLRYEDLATNKFVAILPFASRDASDNWRVELLNIHVEPKDLVGFKCLMAARVNCNVAYVLKRWAGWSKEDAEAFSESALFGPPVLVPGPLVGWFNEFVPVACWDDIETKHQMRMMWGDPESSD